MNPISAWWRRLRHLGPARLRLALLFAALAASAVTVLTSPLAHADPAPAPSTGQAVTGDPTAPSPQEQAQIQEILRQQSETYTPQQQSDALDQKTGELRKTLPDEGGVLSVFNVTDRAGLPISAYTVKSDTGGLQDWDLGVENLLAELAFMATKWLVAFACWLIAWSLTFGLAKLLLAPAMSVAQALHTRVIVEMGLPGLFLAVCAVVCVCRIFFGDKARGWGDAAISILLAALTTTMLAALPTALMDERHGAVAAARGFALEVAGIILDADPAPADAEGESDGVGDGPEHEAGSGPAGPAALTRPLTDALTDSFIVRPAMLLQYGRTFDGACAKAYSDSRLAQLAYDRQVEARAAQLKKIPDLVSLMPGSTGLAPLADLQITLVSKWAADHFGDPPMDAFEKRCVTGDAAAAKKASLDKVGGALFLLIAAVIVTVLIAGLSGSYLVAQCRIAWDAVRGESALVAGTIPGAGRGYLWDWSASVLRSLAMMLASVIALAILIVVLQAVLNPAQTDWGKELTLRFLGVDLVCIAAVRKRRQLADRTRQIAGNFRTKMNSRSIGGTHGSILTPTGQSPAARRPRIARATARTLVRTTLAGVALAQGNPLAALGYAMPQSIGATALMSRLATGGRRRRRPPVRPAGRHRPRPASDSRRPPGKGPKPARPSTAPTPATQSPTPSSGIWWLEDPTPTKASAPATKPTAPVPAPAAPPKPSAPPRPGTSRPGQRSTMALDWSTFDTPSQPPVPRPNQAAVHPSRRPTATTPAPAASPHQQRLRQRLDRATRPRDNT